MEGGVPPRESLPLRCPSPSRCWNATARLAAAPRVRGEGAATPAATPDHRVAGELTLGGGGGRESSAPLTAPSVGQPPARMGGASGPWAAGCGAGGSRCPYGGDWWAGGGAGGGGRQRRAAATGPHWLGGVARPTQAQPSRCGAAASRDWMRGNRRRQPRKRANQRRGKEKNRTQVPTDRPTCEPCPLPLFPQCPVLFICVYTEPGWRSTHARAMTSPRTTASTGPAAAALQVCAHPRERPVVCLSRVR